MNITSNSTPKDIPRQRWLRIIPPILITCIISYMDRVNIAFAMPGGMDADLGISATMAGLAGGIFFIGYLFLQVPGGKIAVHGSGKKFIGWSLVAWAVISVLTGIVTSQYQLLVLRFLLGVAEGGMLPVVLTMISNWFPDAERGRANAIVIMFVPIAGIITAPLSGWIITALDWRWLFIIEGLMSVVVLVLWAFTVYDRPQEARWISEAEKNYLMQTLAAEQKAIAGKEVKNASLGAVLSDKTMWQLIALNFFYQTGDYGYTLWLPTILKNLTGANMASVGVLAILPFVATLAGIYIISLFSDRSGKRRLWVRFSLYGFAAALQEDLPNLPGDSLGHLARIMEASRKMGELIDGLLKLSQMGAVILPAAPGFYHQPQTIDDLVDFVVARILNLLNIPQDMLPRWGERHFASQLLDFDLASNSGGWQWAASTGCDAQPWFRIFNPITQSQKFDPEGKFIRRYIPELARVPDKHLHFPAAMKPLELQACGLRLGQDYPLPVVQHAQARERTLQRFGVLGAGVATD